MPAAVGAVLTAFGASAATVTFVTTGVGASLINAGLGVALSAAARALMPTPAAVEPSDGQIQIRQDVPVRFWSYGETVVAGALWWLEVGDFNAGADDLVLGHAFNDGRISEIVERRIDGVVVAVDGSGNITTNPYAADLTTARFHVRLGEATETAYSEILSEWSTLARGDGVASSLVILDTAATAEDQFDVFPNSRPEISHRGKWSVVFDWRDATQDRDDPSTWLWSENPVVCLAHEITVKGGMPWSAISGNLAEWTEAADVCDEAVDLKNDTGTESRYRLAGMVTAAEERKTVWRRILDTFDGRLWERADGTLGIQAGKFRPPRCTLTDAHVVGYEYTSGADRLTELDGIRASYLSPAHDFVEQAAEAWPTREAVAALDDTRVGQLNLGMVPSHGQARRIMKRVKVRADAPRLTLRTNLAGLQLEDERTVHVTLDDIGLDVDCEVERWEREAGSPECLVELVVVDATIDAWDADTEQGTAPSVPHDLAASPLTYADGEITGISLTYLDGSITAFINTDTTQNAAGCTRADGATSADFGVVLDQRRKIGRVTVHGSQDNGFVQGGNPTVSLKLMRANLVDGVVGEQTIVATLDPFTDTGNESAGRTIDHYGFTEDDVGDVWTVRVEHNGDPSWNIAVAEILFYEWEES